MSFKIFTLSLWMLLIFFTLVKGSCLEYGHSCWGGHGKRSTDNKIHSKDFMEPLEADFQDLSALKEKMPYDSSESQLSDSADTFAARPDKVSRNEDLNSFKLKRLMHIAYNNNNRNQRQMEFAKNQLLKSENPMRDSERWRRLPIYNMKNFDTPRSNDNGNEWLRKIQHEQQLNDNDYI